MDLKTFQARSMSDALAKVKGALGKDAMILHTRTIKRGGILGIGARNYVEITATVDPRVIAARASAGNKEEAAAPEPSASVEAVSAQVAYRATAPTPPKISVSPVAPWESKSEPSAETATDGDGSASAIREEVVAIRSMVRDLLQKADPSTPPDVPAELIEHYTRFISHEVSNSIVMEMIDRLRPRLGSNPPHWDASGKPVAAQVVGAERIREELVNYVDQMLPPAAPLALVTENRPTIIALVGPTGVGKTTTLAKLAAHMKLREGRSVGLITIDSYRIAAVEQLKTYAQIMQIPIVPVATPEEMQAAIREMASVDLILIDTAGRSQKDDLRIAELRTFLAAAYPDQVHLVLASTSGESTIRQAIEKFSVLGAKQIIFTKLDEAVGFGVILNVLKTAGVRLSYLTTGQSVPDDIEIGSARRVAELILGVDRSGRLSGSPSAAEGAMVQTTEGS